MPIKRLTAKNGQPQSAITPQVLASQILEKWYAPCNRQSGLVRS
jgi:hypothetical protein